MQIVVGFPHLVPGLCRRPKFSQRAFSHGGGQVSVEEGIVLGKGSNQLLGGLAYGFAIQGAGGGYGSAPVVFFRLLDFLFTKVDEGAYDGEPCAVQISDGQEGSELAGIEQTHEKGFHGIVMVMCIGNLVHAVFLGIAVDGTATKIGAGEACFFPVLIPDGTCNVHFMACEGNFQGSTKFCNRCCIEIWLEHGIDIKGGQLKGIFEPLPQDCHGIGQEKAVLAAGNADEDMVAVLNHLKFYDGSHQFAEI